MNRTSRLLAAALAAGALSFAQPPQGGAPPDPQQRVQMRVASLAARLTLTEDQKARATEIFTQSTAAGENARTSMREAQMALRDAIRSNDTSTIDRAAVTSGALQGQMMAIEAKAEASFYALLTAQQKTQYDARPEGGRGPGGGFGPGPAGMGRHGGRPF